MTNPNEPAQSPQAPRFQDPQTPYVPGHQPAYGQPPQGPPPPGPRSHQPSPRPPKKRRWFLSWPIVAPVAFLLGLLIGTAGGSTESGGTTAPTPTEMVTVTAKADPAPAEDTAERPSEEPSSAAGQQSTDAPSEDEEAPAGPSQIGDTVTTGAGNKIKVTAESVVAGEWDDKAGDGTYLLVTVKLTNVQTEPVEPFMEVAVAHGGEGTVAEEAYVDGVNGSWYSDVIPAGATRTFDAAFVASRKQAEDLQITLSWDYAESITFSGSASG